MGIEISIADEIVRRLDDAHFKASSSLRTVMCNESIGAATAYSKLVGAFCGYAYSNVIDPIWKKFPNLKPNTMNGPYVPPSSILSQESENALKSFLSTAEETFKFIEKAVPKQQNADIFEYGGLEELRETVSAIRDFLRDRSVNAEQDAAANP